MKATNGIIIKNFLLKNISYYNIGGKTKYYYIPDHLEDLISFFKETIKSKSKFYIVGNTSNILFNDKLYNGTIINLKGFTNYIYQDKNKITAGASVPLTTLIDFAIDQSLKGIENLCGIPGTFGGALIMNAGAFNTEIGKYIEYVKVLTLKGTVKILTNDKIKFIYRSAEPLNKYIILEACIKLQKGNKKDLLKRKKEILNKRKKKQPLEYPSCGSVFKRPKDNFAGTLIEQCQLKGLQKGDAQISEKHCNFIINKGQAKAKDVMYLIQKVQKTVYEKFKIKLETEVKLFNF